MTIYTYPFPDSAMLTSCSYDDMECELSVIFKTGRTYTYVDVPKSTYDDLINAPSAGRHFNSIKMELKEK